MAFLRPATPGTVVTLAATILLILVSVSVPILKSFYFLKSNFNVQGGGNNVDSDVTLGCWGFCVGSICSNSTLGYQLNADSLFGFDSDLISLPNTLIKGLTYALIIHPIAAGFAAASAFCGILGHIRELSFLLTRLATWFAGLGSLLTFIAFTFDIILFSIAKSRINSTSINVKPSSVFTSASLGNAIWLTLAGFLLLAFSGCCFRFGRSVVGQRGPRSKPLPDSDYTAAARRDALAAEELRAAEMGSAVGSNSYTSSQRKERGLPSFAESPAVGRAGYSPAGENVPLWELVNDDENLGSIYRDDETISGVGQGYGRCSTGPSREGLVAGAGSITEAAAMAAISPGRHAQGASSTEAFQSMYVNEPRRELSQTSGAIPFMPQPPPGQPYASYGHDGRYNTTSPVPSYGTHHPTTARPSAIPIRPLSISEPTGSYLNVPGGNSAYSPNSGMNSYYTAASSTPTPETPSGHTSLGSYPPSNHSQPQSSITNPNSLPYGTAYELRSQVHQPYSTTGTFGQGPNHASGYYDGGSNLTSFNESAPDSNPRTGSQNQGSGPGQLDISPSSPNGGRRVPTNGSFGYNSRW